MARVRLAPVLACSSAGLLLACTGLAPAGPQRHLEVSASAYNSVVSQTNDQPSLGAWGDRLEPGMRAIAVSRDLIGLGLGRGVRVRIDGLPGEYRVLDKMAARWKRKIDIYMGNDVKAARGWGVRRVTIRWTPGPP